MFHAPGRVTSPERRDHPRCAIELDVSRSARPSVFIGFTENLSEGGIFLATHLLAHVGEAIAFAFHLPGTAQRVAGLGEVCWTRAPSEDLNVPPGVGVRFVSLEPGCLREIQRFIALHGR